MLTWVRQNSNTSLCWDSTSSTNIISSISHSPSLFHSLSLFRSVSLAPAPSPTCTSKATCYYHSFTMFALNGHTNKLFIAEHWVIIYVHVYVYCCCINAVHVSCLIVCVCVENCMYILLFIKWGKWNKYFIQLIHSVPLLKVINYEIEHLSLMDLDFPPVATTFNFCHIFHPVHGFICIPCQPQM